MSRLGGSGKVAFGKRAVECVKLLRERKDRPAANVAKLHLAEHLQISEPPGVKLHAGVLAHLCQPLAASRLELGR